MTDEMRILGRILGELYRTQKRVDPDMYGGDDAKIYGLLNGFEYVIEGELDRIGCVTNAELEAVEDVLDEIWQDPAKMAAFKGFYDIEPELKQRGVSRAKAMAILRYLYADGRFNPIMDKMKGSGSPSECQKFTLSDWDS